MQVITTQKGSYDIIVVGGGIAGVSSALSAVRQGKKVLLIEKHINLGGLATIGLISWFEPLCDGNYRQMIGGIGQELLELAIGCGYDNLPKHWGGTSGNEQSSERFSSFYSPTFFSLVLDKLLRDNGVEILYDTLVTYPQMEGNLCKGIIVENMDGRSFYGAKVIIDATGDATVAHRAGIPTRTHQNTQTLVVHDVDKQKAMEFVETNNMTKLRHWQWLKPSNDTLGEVNVQTENEYIARCKQTALQNYQGTDKNLREIMSLPQMPQIRVIRTVVGDVTFKGEQCDRDKAVAQSIGSMGDFAHNDYRFDIPYGCIFNSQFPNILFAGRIVSAVDNGIGVLRVIPGCCVTGQAAGITASVMIDQNTNFAESYPSVRKKLEQDGVFFRI
ncbi:MAG: FAD-dependent oxidoreductase [Clostridia bacterium]|nr:FAD-dependent oxidoreductase [Clostridia bacterium]